MDPVINLFCPERFLPQGRHLLCHFFQCHGFYIFTAFVIRQIQHSITPVSFIIIYMSRSIPDPAAQLPPSGASEHTDEKTVKWVDARKELDPSLLKGRFIKAPSQPAG